MYELLKTDGKAKLEEDFRHGARNDRDPGIYERSVTAAAIKGAVSTDDSPCRLKTQVELSNTYHLHVRPGDEIVRKMGGLRWLYELGRADTRRTPADFQSVFHLQALRKIKEEGVAAFTLI